MQITTGGKPPPRNENRAEYERGFAYGEQMKAMHDANSLHALQAVRAPRGEYELGFCAAIQGQQSRYAR